MLYFVKPYKSKEHSIQNDLKNNEINSISNRKMKLILMAFCLAFYSSAELAYFNFSSTMFQFMDISLSAEDAAFVQSMLSAAYTFGRLFTAFISTKIMVS